MTTPANTEVPKVRNLKELARKFKIDIGTTLQGNSSYYDSGFLSRIKSDFTQVFPGTFFATTRAAYPGQDELTNHIIRSLVRPNRMQLIMHPGFSHVDVLGRWLELPPEEVKEEMRAVAALYVGYIKAIKRFDGRPPLVQFLTEALFYDNSTGQGRYMDTPFYEAFGDQLISGSYLLFEEEASKHGLELGTDYTPVWSETDMIHPGGHTSYAASEGRRAKQEIADALGIPYDDVVLDIASQHHMMFGQKAPGWEFMRGDPTYDGMTQAVLELKKGLEGNTRIHIDSLHVLGGGATQGTIVEGLGTAMQVAFDLGPDTVPSILMWEPINQVSPTGEHEHFVNQGLYDERYRPTQAYQRLIGRFA